MTAAEVTLSIAVLALLAYVAWAQRQWARERDQWSGERADLLQRIQAPEIAVAEHGRPKREKRPSAQVIAFDDDEAMAKAIEARNGGAV